MRTFLLTASIIAMTSSAAIAEGGQAPQPLPPVAIAAATYDWSGAYVGLGYSMNMADSRFINPTLDRPVDDGSGASIFAGYLFQNGNLVYGGELAYYMLNEQTFTGFPASQAYYDTVIDAGLRLGYAFDRFMVFGQAGYSMTTFIAPALNREFDQTGYNLGLGADYAVTDQVSVGILYTHRSMEGDSLTPGRPYEVEQSSFSLRAAYRF